jgi:hypothetical protein
MVPFVTAISPPLLWQVQAGGWNITGWPALPGRPGPTNTRNHPTSPDGGHPVRTGHDLGPADADQDSARWVEELQHDPVAFDGDSLSHRDPNPTNLVVDGPRAWLVDWGWGLPQPRVAHWPTSSCRSPRPDGTPPNGHSRTFPYGARPLQMPSRMHAEANARM